MVEKKKKTTKISWDKAPFEYGVATAHVAGNTRGNFVKVLGQGAGGVVLKVEFLNGEKSGLECNAPSRAFDEVDIKDIPQAVKMACGIA